MATKYVGPFTTSLLNQKGKRVATLLWGDPLHELGGGVGPAGSVKVRARGMEGWVPSSALSERSLLEIYIIDVGQGDGVLLKTPDEKWHLIDAGAAGRDQMTKKGAANFLRWKFVKDLGRDRVALANVIVTHPDADHYGGLLDVLAGRLNDGRTFPVEVEHLYHNGLGRWRDSPRLGNTTTGAVGVFPQGARRLKPQGTFITELLDGPDAFRKPKKPFEDGFAEYAALAGTVPRQVSRLSYLDQYLPGYAPSNAGLTIRVLGPILEDLGGKRLGLRVLENQSVTRNGHSIVLRLDYGRARILLTGDLNAKSQQLLQSYHPQSEFPADVAKGCHHGSEDVDFDFVKAMSARVTVISSGDSEDYSHPRPIVMGASARYGREAKGSDGDTMPPLLYSTELARSVKLAYATSAQVTIGDQGAAPTTVSPRSVAVKAGTTDPVYRPLPWTPLSTDLVYGLVNVRTDGVHILCATMEEKGNDFDVKVFQAGVEPGV